MAVTAWSLAVSGLFALDIRETKGLYMQMARNEAITHFDKGQALRGWVASLEGGYMAGGREPELKSYLARNPGRDVRAPSGDDPTPLNPVHLLRFLMAGDYEPSGVHGHISSLKPLREETAPDGWERAALEAFERGGKEAMAIWEINGKPYLRLMKPIYVEEKCMTCHRSQGYRVGDVRGGGSVAVPLGPYFFLQQRDIRSNLFHYGGVWILGLAGIALGAARLSRKIGEREAALDFERKRAEETLSAHTADLERSNGELEEFAFVASHDLQEPLRKVQLFGEVLMNEYAHSLDEQGRDYVGRMRAASVRMQSLIEALLTYSRVSDCATPPAAVDLNEVVQEALSNLEVEILQTGGRVEVTTLPVIEAERTQMIQLFQNLMGNALKFRPPDVAPMLKIRADCVIGASRKMHEPFTRISFEDNGIGFDEKFAERIFAPFERLHGQNEYRGAGIGLAICRKIVNRHGGAITVKSEKGRGSVFVVTLPLKQTKA